MRTPVVVNIICVGYSGKTNVAIIFYLTFWFLYISVVYLCTAVPWVKWLVRLQKITEVHLALTSVTLTVQYFGVLRTTVSQNYWCRKTANLNIHLQDLKKHKANIHKRPKWTLTFAQARQITWQSPDFNIIKWLWGAEWETDSLLQHLKSNWLWNTFIKVVKHLNKEILPISTVQPGKHKSKWWDNFHFGLYPKLLPVIWS